jgi:hypothetical protein
VLGFVNAQAIRDIDNAVARYRGNPVFNITAEVLDRTKVMEDKNREETFNSWITHLPNPIVYIPEVLEGLKHAYFGVEWEIEGVID